MFDKKIIKEIEKLEFNYHSTRVVGLEYKKTLKIHFIILDAILYTLDNNHLLTRIPRGVNLYNLVHSFFIWKPS